ncbi:MAG: type IV pilin protein [Burkholderiales bacterium]
MKRHAGFTLIELMITVVIIAILAAVAYPSYQAHIIRTHRSEAQQFLMDITQREEQYLLDVRQYTNILGPPGTAGSLNLATPSNVAKFYNAPAIVLVAGPPQTYSVSIAPLAGSMMAGDGRLIIDSVMRRCRDLSGNGACGDAGDKPWE